ncbi:MAG: DUF4864 domain-containing protein [Proteobacteria bacterium]|nr:DUF4864 domain-containing protein [Ramlibacter sp.]MCA0214588.1 DUF4864 domain-containing protein [Pseudomonadota bacterium]
MPMNRRLHIALLTALLAGAALAVPAGAMAAAVALSDADAASVRATVQGQLDAFAADDAARAFSYAAANVRQRMGTAQRFMAMVRAGYPVVYRPASVAFLVPQRLADGTAVLRAQMTDSQGAGWLAVYTLVRQKDRSWRISGCEVQPGQGRVT